MTTLPRPKPAFRPPPLPSAEELERRGITFHPLTEQPASPVRVREHGFCLGVFPTPRAAAPTIQRLP